MASCCVFAVSPLLGFCYVFSIISIINKSAMVESSVPNQLLSLLQTVLDQEKSVSFENTVKRANEIDAQLESLAKDEKYECLRLSKLAN